MTGSQTPSLGTTKASGESGAESKLKILVVGATGFLGAKILRNLAGDESATVLAMSRKDTPSDGVGGVEWVRGDMMHPTSLDRAL